MSARDLFRWVKELVSDLPLVTPRDPDPPFYEEIPVGPEHDRRELFRAWARSVPEPELEELMGELGPWLYDLDQLAEVGHDLAYRFGVAAGEVEDEQAFAERPTDRLPVTYWRRWSPGELPTMEDDGVGFTTAADIPADVFKPFSSVRVRWFAGGLASAAALFLAITGLPALLESPATAPMAEPVPEQELVSLVEDSVSLSPLPLEDLVVPTCPLPEPSLNAAAVATVSAPPSRWRTSPVRITDTGGVVVREKGQPDQLVIAREMAPNEEPPKDAHVIDASDNRDTGIRVRMTRGALVFDLGEE